MNDKTIDKIIKAAYVLTALICFNILAFYYDAQWIQAAIILDASVIVSGTGITLIQKINVNNNP